MSTREYFAKRLRSESKAFNAVTRALPGDRLDYKPHEKNTCAGDLAWQIAVEMSQLPELLRTGEIRWEGGEAPKSIGEIADAMERNTKAAHEAAQNVDDERWKSTGRFFYKGNLVWENSVENIAWEFLLDMIHHRGQLTAYLRPMGGKVPSCYGPTADDKA